MRLALIHVCLAPGSRKPLRTVTNERSRCIYTNSVMFTRWSLLTLINVLGTISSFVSGRTRTRKRPIYRTRITNGVRMTRIWRTRVVQMTQKSRFTWRTITPKTTDTIDTRGTVKTRRIRTIINILVAIGTCPAINTNAWIAAVSVGASSTVLTNWRSVLIKKKDKSETFHAILKLNSHNIHYLLECAFVNVILTKLSRKVRWTSAVICVNGIYTCATVLA